MTTSYSLSTCHNCRQPTYRVQRSVNSWAAVARLCPHTNVLVLNNNYQNWGILRGVQPVHRTQAQSSLGDPSQLHLGPELPGGPITAAKNTANETIFSLQKYTKMCNFSIDFWNFFCRHSPWPAYWKRCYGALPRTHPPWHCISCKDNQLWWCYS